MNGTIPCIQNLCATEFHVKAFTCSDTVNTTELAIAIDPTLGQSTEDLTNLLTTLEDMQTRRA